MEGGGETNIKEAFRNFVAQNTRRGVACEL